MSITLSVKANDPEVERLLAYLNANLDSSAQDKIWLLQRATKWLQATTAFNYECSKVEATLGLNDAASLSLEPLDTELAPQLR
ncbi:MAG: hypothetical protein ACLPXT_14780 [Terracidiphilus sp.]